jgi:cytochrome oxidase Cu insertion factor (SCO1/SenC/PrrC family)
VWPGGRRPAPDFSLRDQRGTSVSLTRERGRAVLLAFVDPLCEKACATELLALASVLHDVASAPRPALLIVSLNPDATSVDALAAGRLWGLEGNWHWLVGSRARLERVWSAYGVEREAGSSSGVYVIDRRGFERAGVRAPFLPQFVADDLGTLGRESG